MYSLNIIYSLYSFINTSLIKYNKQRFFNFLELTFLVYIQKNAYLHSMKLNIAQYFVI